MAHTIKITFTDEDQAIVKDQIADIKDWVEKAVSGEKNRSWKKFHAHWMDVLLSDESLLLQFINSYKSPFIPLLF